MDLRVSGISSASAGKSRSTEQLAAGSDGQQVRWAFCTLVDHALCRDDDREHDPYDDSSCGTGSKDVIVIEHSDEIRVGHAKTLELVYKIRDDKSGGRERAIAVADR
jgi:hypothetical protein